MIMLVPTPSHSATSISRTCWLGVGGARALGEGFKPCQSDSPDSPIGEGVM